MRATFTSVNQTIPVFTSILKKPKDPIPSEDPTQLRKTNKAASNPFENE